MNLQEEFPGIDYFRIIAAFLVVANHTSPLSSVNGTADFILTRIIARVAVPFFFMTSGFFLFRGKATDSEADRVRLFRFLRKTAALYAISTLLYLPVNIYAGTFRTEHLAKELLKDIVFDGTFYHLWYLPAAMIGATIAWLLLKRLGPGHAFGIAFILYLVGLFGDSYYGIAERVPFLQSFYASVFTVSDYTRNGLFFAPVFLVLGAMMAPPARRLQPKACFTGLAVAFLLMLAEALLLHTCGIPRHDSMYLTLLPCAALLFQSLLHINGKTRKELRDISTLIYLVHPMMIILVRWLAKAAGLKRWLIANSVIHFLAVAVSSLAAAEAILLLLRVFQNRELAPEHATMDRAWAEIDLTCLSHNVQVLRKAMPDGCKLMAAVKGNAYGHGDVEVAKHLNQIGIDAFVVAAIDEGIRLRKHGIKGTILILGYTVPERAGELARYRLSQTVVDREHAVRLNACGKPIHVHIKVDTGMHRMGEPWDHVSEIASIFGLKNLYVDGIYTHLSVSDSMEPEDAQFTEMQIDRFYHLLETLREQNVTLPKIHVQSSYGLLNYPMLKCDYARVGIALYGTLSSPHDQTRLHLDIKNVLSLKARVSLVRTVTAGESVGYGRHFIAERDTCVAILPIGYGDGIPRNLSGGRGSVLIHGCRAPIIGRICMDQLMVDVTGIPDVKRGDVATLIGRDGSAEITAEQAAADAGTITNELLSRIGIRVKRIFYSS